MIDLIYYSIIGITFIYKFIIYAIETINEILNKNS